MTQEGQGPRPEDTLVPPTTTRWSEDSSPDAEEGLVAPFIPGQTRRPHEARRGSGPGAGREPAEGAGTAPPDEGRGTVEPEPLDAAEEAFPFDMPWGAEPPPDAGDPMAAEDSAAAEDEFPLEAFDIDPEDEGPAYEGPAYEEPALEDAGGAGSGGYGPTGAGAAEEVAERLEHLAARLRSEGADGVERELASSDRLTSLMAALLAGHLASR